MMEWRGYFFKNSHEEGVPPPLTRRLLRYLEYVANWMWLTVPFVVVTVPLLLLPLLLMMMAVGGCYDKLTRSLVPRCKPHQGTDVCVASLILALVLLFPILLYFPVFPCLSSLSSLRNLTNRKEERIATAINAASGGGFVGSGPGSSGTLSPNTAASESGSIGSASNRSFSVRSDSVRGGSSNFRGSGGVRVCVLFCSTARENRLTNEKTPAFERVNAYFRFPKSCTWIC